MKQEGRSLLMYCSVRASCLKCFVLQESVLGEIMMLERSEFAWIMIHLQLVALQRRRFGSAKIEDC